MRLNKENSETVRELEIEGLLRSGDVESRRDAVYTLKELKNRALAEDLLIKCFQDIDWRIRKSATDILIELKESSIVPKLINALYSDNANTRNSAIEVLTAFGAGSVARLIEAFGPANPDVKKFIIDILGNITDKKVTQFLLMAIHDEKNDDNVKAAAIEHLGKIKSVVVVNKLLSVLSGDNTFLCYYAITALGNIGDDSAINALISVLPRKELRKPVIKALGQIASVSSLVSIAKFLNDESKGVCEETIVAIENFYIKGVPEEIIVREIKKAAGKDALKISLPYTRSHKKDVKKAAILLLGLFKEKSVISAILEMSSEEEPQEAVIRSLVYIAKESPDALMPYFASGDVFMKRILCDVAGKTGLPVFFKPLVKMLKDRDSHSRAKAAHALSNIGNPEAAKHIKSLLLDEYEDIQETAIMAMAALKEGIDTAELISLLSDRNSLLRRNSARLLGLIGEESAIEPLGIALKDSDLRVRNAVVDAIAAIDGKKVLKYLLLALTDEHPDVRRSATFAIGKMKTGKSFDALVLLLRDQDVWVRAAALRGLGMSENRKAVRHIISVLNDESGIVRNSAIEVLANFREEKVKSVLIDLLKDKDPEIRSTAVGSLSHFKGVFENLLPVLKDEDWAVRKQVVDVLGKFFIDESSSYLQEVANTDNDAEVRKSAEGYLGV